MSTRRQRSINNHANAGLLYRQIAETKKARLEDFSDGELIDELVRRWGRDKVSIRLGEPEK